ncbi:hypothetical protein C1N53_20855 [Pontibacter sp. SGAir0037]|nr:hypothetical protein C1N53_20855 [Pontibacter sp. SGAir0037]
MQEQQLQQAFEQIIGLPLTRTTRTELIEYFHFGNAHYTTPQGLVLDVGAFTLAVNCPWQLQQPGGETIEHKEVFMRKREAGLPTPGWNWKIPGDNLRDQRLKEFIHQHGELLVKSVESTGNYGLILHIGQQIQLIITPDTAKTTEEFWQLFSNTAENFRIGAGPAGVV